MIRKFKTLLKLLVGALVLILVTFLGTRIYFSQSGAPLEIWHTYVPKEMSIAQMEKSDWQGYLAHEQRIFDELKTEVVQKLDDDDQIPSNRYFAGSPVHTFAFEQDWNRTYTLEPQGPPVGAAVLLHGLTDSPYSLRHLAYRYAQAGYAVLAIRLPGHGTVPAGLTDVEWEDWLAATRLAVREARRLAGDKGDLQIVGFSNGGALALKYALDALEDPALTRPDHLVLISPMVGITRFARFAGLAGLPAFLPAFAKASWLSVLPEFNPFKYNSFPVNGARQSHRLTVALQEAITRQADRGALKDLAPVLTFQSVMDFTVSTRAIIDALYRRLPANGSELVLFDVNRHTKLSLLMRTTTYEALQRMLPPAPRNFTTTIITNSAGSADVVERTVAAGQTEETERLLGITYPRDVYSLSHVALPFPSSDGLYGSDPDPNEDFGIELGSMAVRGERGALIVSLDALVRMSSNPFFPYLVERVENQFIARDLPAPTPVPAPAPVPVPVPAEDTSAPSPATPDSP